MLRFLVLAAILAIGCRLMLGRWPWDYLRGSSVRQQAVGRARRLLGITGTANRSEILAAHKRLVAMVHPDRGGSNDQVHEANAARDLLLDELLHEISPK